MHSKESTAQSRSVLHQARSSLTGRNARIWTIFTLLFSMAAAHAQTGFEEDSDDKDKPWEEAAIQLPPAPKAENLLPFDVSPTATQSFAIDANSLSVGADGVIRYTLVATSSSGAKNISYEGIHCQTYERKLYAFGQPDGTWVRSRRNKWETIQNYAANRPHAALAKDFFCLEQTVAGKASDMVSRIRNKKTLAPQDYR